MKRFNGQALVLVGLCACGGGRSLELQVLDPCNGSAFNGNNVAYVEISVSSPDLDAPIRKTFGAGAQSGSLDKVTAVSRATIEIDGLTAASDGGVGNVVAAGGLGYLDLGSGADAFKVIAGRVSTFVRTTPSDGGGGVCADQNSARSLHTATALADGRVLVAGGAADTAAVASTEIYTPESGSFAAGPDMHTARVAHTATALIDGRVMLAGGVDAAGKPVTSLEVFDGSTFQRPVSLDGRAYHTATRLQDGRVLLAGGIGTAGALATSAIYDPSDESITNGPPLKSPRARHAAVLVDDAVVALIGGIDDASVVAAIEFVDVANGVSIVGPQLQTPRSDAVVGFLDSKRAIVVAGGYSARVDDVARGTGINDIEVIQVADAVGSSSVACSGAQMIEGRGVATMAPVAHGFVVIGGVNTPGQVSATAELLTFDAGPCRPTITPAEGDLYASRYGAAVATLASGDVLVTGGAGVSNGSVLSRKAAEIFIVPR